MKEWLSLQRSRLKRCSMNVGWSQAGGHCCSALGRRHWKCSGEAPQLLTQRRNKVVLRHPPKPGLGQQQGGSEGRGVCCQA